MLKSDVLKKLFAIYKPTEELMYVSKDVLIQRFIDAKVLDVQFEEITVENCADYRVLGFFSPKSYLQKNAIVVGARINGAPAAYGAGILKAGRGAYFKVENSDLCYDGIYTFEEFRGRGLATLILKEILHRAEESRSIKLVSLNVRPDNATAKKLYKKLGFETRRVVTFYKKWRIKIPYYRI